MSLTWNKVLEHSSYSLTNGKQNCLSPYPLLLGFVECHPQLGLKRVRTARDRMTGSVAALGQAVTLASISSSSSQPPGLPSTVRAVPFSVAFAVPSRARRNTDKGYIVSRPRVRLSCRLLCRELNSSFFNGGAWGLATVELSSSNSNSQNQNKGGALGTQMNIFERVARVIKSYVNAIVSSVEDPEKILDQTVLEMNDDLTKMRQASAQVLASQKQLENRYKTARQAAEDWYRRAKLALEKGDDNLAREALKRRKSYEDNANALQSQLEQQKNVVEKLIANTRLLESKIQEAKSKKDTLKARAQSAKTAQKVSEMLGTVNTSSALAVFEKMEEKVMALEAEADALNQMNTDDLEGKFALLENSSVDEDLSRLKRDMLGTSKKEELPPGRSPVSSARPAYPFQDLEIEKELNELRRNAKEF